MWWIITVHYGWYAANMAGGGAQDPLLMPIDVSWGSRDHEIVLDRRQRPPVINTAGDPYDPPIVIDDPRLVMTIVRNEAAFNVAWVLAYRNAVNADSSPAFRLWLARCSTSQQESVASGRRLVLPDDL